jgi:hypothetical protein
LFLSFFLSLLLFSSSLPTDHLTCPCF